MLVYCDGLRRRWWFVHQNCKSKESWKRWVKLSESLIKLLSNVLFYSLLFWGLNSGLVCLDGSCHQAHPRSEDFTQGSQDIEHFHDLKWTNKNWRFRHSKSPPTHVWLCSNCHWNALLPIAWDLSRKTLQSEIWYLVSWLHLVRNGDTETRLWCQFHERAGFEDIKRKLPIDSVDLQLRFEGLSSRYAHQGSNETPFDA